MILRTTVFVTLAWSASAQTFSEDASWIASDANSQGHFAGSLALTGSNAFVGAYTEGAAGSVYRFDAPQDTEGAKLTPPPLTALQDYGYSVAANSNRLVIGAPRDLAGSTRAGTVSLYDASTSVFLAEFSASDGAWNDQLGFAVDIHGGVVLAGAPNADTTAQGTGAAYTFNANTGQPLKKLVASDGAPGDFFGGACALDAQTAIVGARWHDAAGNEAGAAYLFNALSGVQQHKLLPTGQAAEASFGYAVAVDGNLAVVCAPFQSAAYVFDVSTGLELARLTPIDGDTSLGFGYSVAMSNGLILVGGTGNAYLFDAVNLTQLAQFSAAHPGVSSAFGWAVALDGDIALVADPFTMQGNEVVGAVYRFDLSLASGTGASYCAGDGFGATACPCNQFGELGAGCLNATGTGARLSAAGLASISNDSFQLAVQGAPANKPGIILRGSTQPNGGNGFPIGNGLLCIGGNTARSQVQLSSPVGTLVFDQFQGQGFGGTSLGTGVSTNYQLWYRDPLNSCTTSKFNTSNGWSTIWLP